MFEQEILQFVKENFTRINKNTYSISNMNFYMDTNKNKFFNITQDCVYDKRYNLFCKDTLHSLMYNDENITFKTILLLLFCTSDNSYSGSNCVYLAGNNIIVNVKPRQCDYYNLTVNLTDPSDEMLLSEDTFPYDCNEYFVNGIKNLNLSNTRSNYFIKKDIIQSFNKNIYKSVYKDILYFLYIINLYPIVKNYRSGFNQTNQQLCNILDSIKRTTYNLSDTNSIIIQRKPITNNVTITSYMSSKNTNNSEQITYSDYIRDLDNLKV